MNTLIQQIIDQVIVKKALLKDYPKPGIIFLAIDPLFNDPTTRKMLSKAVNSSVNPQSFDAVASIASRGYLFSGMLANQLGDKGEFLVQKVKSPGDSRYVQIDTTTEYSSDALQVLKNSIQPGKKYLLTDDLIATGGSVNTAIQLIRQCGGIVDTVLVMTELSDFKARENLKKQGVDLVSLLQFTQADLEKLLVMQEGYDQLPPSAITYQLTHHTKGEQALLKANQSGSLSVQLASQSPLKVAATQLALKSLFDPLQTSITALTTPSGVNSQPFGYAETILGAANRLKSLETNCANPKDTVLVAMENGIRYCEEDQSYYDFAHVIVKQDGKTFSQTQDCCKIPTAIITAMRKDTNQVFQETWGEAAKRMGLVQDSANPHQEKAFGGISRVDHLFKALCISLGKLKTQMLEQNPIEPEDQEVAVNRFVELKGKKPTNKYAKKGVFFTASNDEISKPINFYNHGCPVGTWKIDPEKVARNSFQVFATGDAFSVMSPDIEISGANIIIHVGLEHANYTPAVLLQEALQLCRCAYEHGARSITIALPDQFHPLVNVNDFNNLLLSLFKASGANTVYFYDKHYTGKLDETNLNTPLPLKLSNHSDSSHYTIDREEVSTYLKLPQNANTRLDQQVMHLTRKRNFEKNWSRFSPKDPIFVDLLANEKNQSELSVPKITVQPHVVLCCSANKPLAEKIAASLRRRGEMVKLYSIEGTGEKASIPEDAPICGAIVTIIQSTRPNPDNTKESIDYQKNGASSYLFEAAMIARQAHLRGAETVNLINPYQFSARSDKAEDNVKGKTGAYVQQNGLLLEAAGVNHVVTAECHDNHTMSGSYTGKKIKGSAVSALSTLLTRLATEWISDTEHPMQGRLRLVTPDAGAAKRTKELTEQLQAIMGSKLCQTRVLGEKQRDSHKDDSALISSLNSGNVGINPEDKFLITDDETATGNTLCQAVEGLSKNGAKDIVVVVVHNNMPLDWLSRQLCLARFLYIGVNELHFSDTQEMGVLASSYENLIASYSERTGLTSSKVAEQVFSWFKDNIAKNFTDKSEAYLQQAFSKFQSSFTLLDSKIKVHSLANEFANKVVTKPYMGNAHAFEYKVEGYIEKIRNSQVKTIVAFAGASLPAAAAVALELGLPLQVIPQTVAGVSQQKLSLPKKAFALIGTACELTAKALQKDTGYSVETDAELVIVNQPNEESNSAQSIDLKSGITHAVTALEKIYKTIKTDPKLKDRPVKLLGIGNEGQVFAGQLSHLLIKHGFYVGVVAVDQSSSLSNHSAVYTGKSGDEQLFVGRNSLDMGDVCIAVAPALSADASKAVTNLTGTAKVHCPYSLTVLGSVPSEDFQKAAVPGIYAAQSGLPMFGTAPGVKKTADASLRASASM